MVQERGGWYVLLHMLRSFCEHGDELLSSIKFSKFLDYLSDS
jgi:hypothetical protein